MKKTTTTFALVGAGGIASAHALAFAESKKADLVAICEKNPASAKKAGETHSVPVYTSVDELLENGPAIDAAVVCTPPNTHLEICCQLLRAGVHVLCEKPLSITSENARAMAEVAGRSGRLLTMASKFRCVADIRKAKEMLDEGTIGDVIMFENGFTSAVDMKDRWNSKPKISGGGVLIDNGTHSLDIARFFLGPLAQLHVVEGKRAQGLPVEETVMIFLKSLDGTMGVIDLSWTINKNLDHFVRIHGTNGTIEVGWGESKYHTGDGEWKIFGTGYDKIGAFLHQLDNFAAAIHGEEDLLITTEDGIASVEAVEAAYRSLRETTWSDVEHPAPEAAA